MVIIKLFGGLGNQLFQYAFGKATAERLGASLWLDRSWFTGIPAGVTPRTYELGHFSIAEGEADPSDLRRFVGGGLAGKLNRLSDRILAGRRDVRLVERGWGFDPEIAAVDCMGVYLDGYWQSEKYFQTSTETLRRAFAFRDIPRDGRVQELVRDIQGRHSVSLHVRRGDYVSRPASADLYADAFSEGYYERAVASVREVVPDPMFVVFSDDPVWVRENAIVDGAVRIVDFAPSGAAWIDLFLMSKCRHHITANSTFSWWGAWLGSSPDKNVFTPRRWFRDGRDESDLIPEGWVRL